jgi:hypothetical protein
MRLGHVRVRLALALFATTIALTAVAGWIHLTAERTTIVDEWGLPGAEGMLAVSCAFVGLLIARRTSNPTGWIFTTMGLGSAAQYLTEEYSKAALAAGASLPGPATAAWIAEWIWVPLVGSVGLLLLVFPDDRIESRPGRVIASFLVVGAFTSFLAAAFMSPMVATWDVPNPYHLGGISQDQADAVFIVAVLVMMLSAVAAAIRLAARLRHATGIRRQQLKWFAYAAVFGTISMVFSALPATTAVASKFTVFGIISIAVASAIAVLKYRLYDIDLVINRTLVYATLTAVLGALYVGLVFAFQAILSPFTAQSDLAIAGSTLAVAALFRPARSRVQDFIDRRFYRRKFDAERTVAEFNLHLRDEVDLSAVRAQLTEVVEDTMQPTHVSLWMRPVIDR